MNILDKNTNENIITNIERKKNNQSKKKIPEDTTISIHVKLFSRFYINQHLNIILLLLKLIYNMDKEISKSMDKKKLIETKRKKNI